MEVSEAVVELLKVVVAARNDMRSHKLSKFRATKPHRSLGANIMKIEKTLQPVKELLAEQCATMAYQPREGRGEIII